jgi:hypothetical protein
VRETVKKSKELAQDVLDALRGVRGPVQRQAIASPAHRPQFTRQREFTGESSRGHHLEFLQKSAKSRHLLR